MHYSYHIKYGRNNISARNRTASGHARAPTRAADPGLFRGRSLLNGSADRTRTSKGRRGGGVHNKWIAKTTNGPRPDGNEPGTGRTILFIFGRVNRYPVLCVMKPRPRSPGGRQPLSAERAP